MISNKCLWVNQSKKQESSLASKKPIGLNIILFIILGLIALSITVYTSYAIFSADISGNNTISISFKKSERHPLLTALILGKSNSNVVTTGDGLYSTTETNSGNPSYYYHGNVTNNYVKLDEDKDGVADTLYRIIRINEDGSVRLIRQEGIDNNATYKFNPKTSDYKYMYYSESNVENGIMKIVNDWYSNTFEGTDLDTNIIVESEFCEQAKITWYNNEESDLTAGSQTMTPATNDYQPTYKCATDANGKGILNKKIGLITMDEVVFTGMPLYIGSQTNYTSTYLQTTDQYFWTISPAGLSMGGLYGTNAYAWCVDPSGGVIECEVALYFSMIDIDYVARPVINLSSNTRVTGDGTSTSPFTIIS